MQTQKQPNLRFIIATTAISLLMILTPGFECEEWPVLGPDGFYRYVEGGFYSLSFIPETVTIPVGGSERITFVFITNDPAFFNGDGTPSFTANGLKFEVGDVPRELKVLQVEEKTWVSRTCRATFDVHTDGLTQGFYNVPVEARGFTFDPNNPFKIYTKGTLKVKVMPWELESAAQAAQIVGGAYHSLAILADGSVWSWGMNDKGQLGDGTTISRLAPVPVHGLPGSAVAVAAGGAHSLALLADGTIWGWGDNGRHQITSDYSLRILLPQEVDKMGSIIAIAAGAEHSILLTADGLVFCRGANDSGQLGTGNTEQSYYWDNVALDIPRVFTKIAAGGDSSFAIDAQGRVWGWGDNSSRQLGDDSSFHFVAPTPIGLFEATEIAAGINHILALTTDGTVRALGGNQYGQLGIEGDGRRVPVTVPGLPEITAIDTGFFHSMALGADGKVYAWGDNNFGQLASLTGPPGASIEDLDNVQAIASGGRHSLCLMPDCGTVWAWGDNGAGQLGDGTGASSSEPVQVDRIGLASDFEPCEVPLSVIIVGKGVVRAPLAGIECSSTCGKSFPSGVEIALTADPDDDWFFKGWGGDAQGTEDTVNLLMDGSKNCIAYFEQVPSPPTARFTFYPQHPYSTDKVFFDASESTDNGRIILYQWDFDNDGDFDGLMLDNTLDGSFTAAFVREFREGTYTVRLRVTDDDGLTNETTSDVLVSWFDPSEYDLGDAPDSSNSIGRSMLAYPVDGIEAHYPTVYNHGSGPQGPRHHDPQNGIYLGRTVTRENEADVGVDEDPNNNIDWLSVSPDQDGGDDGVQLPLQLPNCERATLQYTITAVDPPHQYMYVNVWLDFNRDGDWDDTLTCPDGSTVREWAVRNDEQYFFESGTSTLTTPSFKCWHPSPEAEHDPLWMRITISEQQPPSSATDGTIGYGGAGPANGYEYGETEDYYIQP